MPYSWTNGRQDDLNRLTFKERVDEVLRLEQKQTEEGLTCLEGDYLSRLRYVENGIIAQIIKIGLTEYEARHLNHFRAPMIVHGRGMRVCLTRALLLLVRNRDKEKTALLHLELASTKMFRPRRRRTQKP